MFFIQGLLCNFITYLIFMYILMMFLIHTDVLC